MQFEQLGPYRLGKRLGQGGMGAVYEVVDTQTGQEAAVKVLAPGLATHEGFRVRFEAEIESLKKLRHPNIVRLYGYGEQAGTLYYAMEMVHGTSLEDELRRGRRFGWREVTHIAVKLCRALKHAHDHGVIHRDLKPANLLLTADGEIKLSDFGIARLFGNSRLTSDGGVLGTAEYMAPEQASGQKVTDRCDQYSLGGVMYTLLTGRPPFRARTLVEMLQLQRYADPEPVASLARETPPELARIVHQLLEKDPQKRFPNTLILARSLEAMEHGLSIPATRPPEEAGDSAAGPSQSAETYDPLAPTLSPDDFSRSPAPKPATPAPEADAAEAGPEPAEAGGLASSAPEGAASATPDRFTKIDERRDEGGGIRETLAGLLAPQTLALAAALAILLAGGWYLMRPPSADELYDRIESAAGGGNLDDLQAAQRDIEAFLTRFPDDPRAERVQALADEAEQSSPIERAFADAKRHALINPELGLLKFTALIDVYDDGARSSEITRHYVRLARVQQARLQKRVDKYVDEGRKLIESRLAKAAEIAPADPTAAEKIYAGIVELYREKPWADDLVERARGALHDGPKRQAAAN